MKKFILSAICISFVSSGAYSAPPALKMLLSEAREGIKLMTKRNISTLQKSTPGYRPDSQAEVRLVRATVPIRVQFTDRNCENYISLYPFKEDDSKIREPTLGIQSKYGVLVHLKKKP